MKIVQFVFLALLFLNSINAQGQNKMHFSFGYDAEITTSTEAQITVSIPNGRVVHLYSGTLSQYELTDKENFIFKGKYKISTYFKTNGYGQDTVSYDFELNGTEIETLISIDFDFRNKLVKKRNIYEKGKKVINGYIRINKYYEPPKEIGIEPFNGEISLKSEQGPIFKIKNNSTDTLYGEHLAGYFWGTLSYLKNDSVCYKTTGNLDYNVCDTYPLYPDSTKIASVGTFGLTRRLKPFNYQFEVMVAKKWQPTGIGIYKEHNNFIWRAVTKEYYRLKYDFKIK